MIVFWLLSKYLERLPEDRFVSLWQTKVMNHLRRHLLWMLVHFFVGVAVFSQILLWGSDSILLELIVYVMVLFVYGIVYAQMTLRFFGAQNGRFIQAQFQGSLDGFDKSNVVYEEKKR